MRRFLLPLALALTSFAPVALADVPPPDSCTTAGKPCDTAPPDYKSPGTCVESTCQKAMPDATLEYPCNLCKAGSGGSAGSSSGGSSGSSAGSGGGAGSTSSGSGSGDDGGCSVRGAPQGGAALALLALGLGALALERRRR